MLRNRQFRSSKAGQQSRILRWVYCKTIFKGKTTAIRWRPDNKSPRTVQLKQDSKSKLLDREGCGNDIKLVRRYLRRRIIQQNKQKTEKNVSDIRKNARRKRNPVPQSKVTNKQDAVKVRMKSVAKNTVRTNESPNCSQKRSEKQSKKLHIRLWSAGTGGTDRNKTYCKTYYKKRKLES